MTRAAAGRRFSVGRTRRWSGLLGLEPRRLLNAGGNGFVADAPDAGLLPSDVSFWYADPSPTVVGQSLKVRFTVDWAGAGVPPFSLTGTVTLQESPNGTTASADVASFTDTFGPFDTSSWSAGIHTFSFHYSGDSHFAPSDSEPATINVLPAGTIQQPQVAVYDADLLGQEGIVKNYSLSLIFPNSGSPGPDLAIAEGGMLRLSGVVSPPGGALPDSSITGTVSLLDGAQVLDTAPIDDFGNYTFNGVPMNLPIEGHDLTVQYPGNTFWAAASQNVHVQITGAAPLTLSLNYVYSPSPDEPYSLVATLGGAIGSTLPTGTIRFDLHTTSTTGPGGDVTVDSDSALGHGAINNGVAAILTGPLPQPDLANRPLTGIGSVPDLFTAWYSGDANYAPVAAQLSISTVGADPFIHARFVTQLYHQLLDREPDASGLSFWAAQLDGGLSDAAVAQQIASSAEYNNRVIDQLYVQDLHRHADAAGLAAWEPQMEAGVTLAAIGTQLLKSEEYINAHLMSGGNNAPADPQNFLQALYGALLGREPDAAGLLYWQGILERDGSSAVVDGLAQSEEAEVALIRSWFTNFLGREPGAADLAYWQPQIDHLTQAQLVAGFAASQEYLAAHAAV